MQSPLDAWFVRRVRFGANHSWMRPHEFQQYDGGPVEDQFAVNSGFDIPKTWPEFRPSGTPPTP